MPVSGLPPPITRMRRQHEPMRRLDVQAHKFSWLDRRRRYSRSRLECRRWQGLTDAETNRRAYAPGHLSELSELVHVPVQADRAPSARWDELPLRPRQ